jgi:uncharacterized membrane protein YqjE
MPDPVDPQARPSGGLSGAIAQLAATIVGMLRTHLELVTVEFEEERVRTMDLLVMIVVATVFFSFALVVFSALIVVLFWETYPVAAMVCVMLVYLAIGAGALLVLRRRIRGRPFEATLAELEKDAAWFRGRQ